MQNPSSSVQATAQLGLAVWNPASFKKCIKQIEETRPDVVHLHNTWFALTPSVLSATSRAKLPVVMTLHNYRLTCINGLLFRNNKPCEDCVGHGSWRGIAHGCYKSRIHSIPAASNVSFHKHKGTWVKNVNKFVALSEFAKEIYERSGLPEEKIEVQYNFVADTPKRVNSPSDSNYVLFAGRLTREKGADILADAWQSLAGQNVKLIVAGAGDDDIENTFRSLSGVEVLGAVPRAEVLKLILAARCVVFPSVWYEGQPMSLIESFACGTPVVTSKIGGMAEMCSGLPSWTMVEPGNTSALSDTLKWIFSPEANASLNEASAAVRNRYERLYSPGIKLRALEALYESVV